MDVKLEVYYERYHWELGIVEEPQFPRPDPNEKLSAEREEAKAQHVEQMRGVHILFSLDCRAM